MFTTHHHHPPPPPSPPQQPPPAATLEVTIISGKHLKNVNWKTGPLKPYAIFWVNPDHKLTTKSDDSSDTKPVWNHRVSLPLPTTGPTTTAASDIFFTLEVFHSISAETPKPFVGSVRIPLSSLPEPTNVSKVRAFELLRPSGRPQGKIKLKIGLSYRSNYQNAPLVGGYYYQNAPYYGGYGAAAAPSAPVDYSPYELRYRAGPGFEVGAVGGMMGGLVLDDGDREKVGCSGSTIKDEFSEYRADY